jgi:ribosomal subunit interface protein
MKTKMKLKTLPWNLVTKHLHGHVLLRKKLREKISKLERHLKHFPPDTVHLHISLEQNPKMAHHTAALTLRVPSNILRSEKSAPDVIKAFDDTVKALPRELESLKAELRRDTFWKRKGRREQMHQLKVAGFATQPQPEGTGPQNLGDVIGELLETHYSRLLRYVRRQLWHDITAGEVPRDAIDPRAVADEVARRALSEPQQKPNGMNYLLWFYVLARKELARRRKALRTQAAETVPLEAPRFLPDDLAVAEGYDAEQPLDINQRQLEPPVVETKDLLPDTRVESPDEIMARRELLAEMRRTASNWLKPEREVFELYYVEGFEPDEVAMILGQPENRVQELIASLHQRLRMEALRQALV